ncbi:MAG TPA: glycosyltransferase family 4 protein [Terriglobia bacterium]|nr:glycosyltransferase family 4 protein [Terriglobia bacterium]
MAEKGQDRTASQLEQSSALRIFHLDTGMDLRGGQHQLLLLARGLRERGLEQLIVCPERSALATEAGDQHFPAFELPEHDPLGAWGVAQLRARLSAERPGILHAHDGRGQTFAWLASLGLPRSYRGLPLHRVAHRRVTFLPSRRSGGRAIYRLKYQHTCHAVIAVSEFIRQQLVECGVPERMIEVIPDGIEIPPQLPSETARREARERWGFAAGDFVAGSLGASTAEKGLDVAVEAARLLETMLPEARLVLAGPSIRGAAGESPRNVRFAPSPQGPPDLAEFFAALDLYLMPSRAEGLGSAALLAMSHGMAVVASRVGGLPEIVTPGETGWLIPPESPEALAEAIAAAAADRARLGEFGVRARARARQFSVENMVRCTEALYVRLAARA